MKFHLKRYVIVTSILLSFFLLFRRQFLPLTQRQPNPINNEPVSFDLIKQRNKFENPIYAKWKLSSSSPLETDLTTRCNDYFQQLLTQENFQINYHDSGYKTEPFVYKRKKWLKERIRSLRKQYKFDKNKDKYDFDQIAKQEFSIVSENQSIHELNIYQHFSHTRIFGKCFATNNNNNNNNGVINMENSQSNQLCKSFVQILYPWMSGNLPIFERNKERSPPQLDDSTDCIIEQIYKNSKGKGIIIPLMTQDKSNNQIQNIGRLIKVLRGLNNTLPIEITFMELITPEAKQQLYDIATSDSQMYPTKQDIAFVDLSPTTTNQVKGSISDSSIITLSSIFTSFEEFIILNQHIIPLIELTKFFNNERYKLHGTYFFKSPSKLKYRTTKFNIGFHEIASFIKNQLIPNKFDKQYFNLYQKGSENGDEVTIDRFFNYQFNNLIDSSLIIFNKSKTLSGLLISGNFEFLYHDDLFNIRINNTPTKTKMDYLWLGQYISGINEQIIFNFNYAIMAGILTPSQNLPKDLIECLEICSSSWGQLSDIDDISLLYITSHQLQNWLNHQKFFESLLKDKYEFKFNELVDNFLITNTNTDTNTNTNGNTNDKDSTKLTMGRIDSSIFEKIKTQPLKIETIIRPPTLIEPINVLGYNEPDQAWVHQDDFDRIGQNGQGGGQGHPFYCVYSSIGDPLKEGIRGLSINVEQSLQKKYKKLIEIWLQD